MWKNCSTSFVQIATYKPRKTQSYRNALLDFIWIKPRAGITMTNSTPFSPITASSPQTWLIWARKACSLFSAMLSEVVFVFLFFFLMIFHSHTIHTLGAIPSETMSADLNMIWRDMLLGLHLKWKALSHSSWTTGLAISVTLNSLSLLYNLKVS